MQISNKQSFLNRSSVIFKLLLILFCFSILWVITLFFAISYVKNLGPYPDVKQYKSIPMPESSIIYDRNGIELYKIYSEKRSYVHYEDIHSNMINAIVAWEDKRFWNHSGYDSIGIFRAIFTGLINGTKFSGTSGITQQLAKVTYLTDERSIERKLKELYLSIELNSIFDKKEILELYLNKIFFGGNSYGIEQASQTFFGTSASNLGVLESSILASLPKAPSSLSPYQHKDVLLGYPLITIGDGLETRIKILSQKTLQENQTQVNILKEFIENMNGVIVWNYLKICWIDRHNINTEIIHIDKNNCGEIKFHHLLAFLNSISLQNDNYRISYRTGRKDYVLWRMLEDGYITFEQYKQEIIRSFWFDFQPYSDEIKYPHFVMYVKKFLENKYTSEQIKTWGLRIYTTLDSRLQNKAHELITLQVEKNIQNFWAKNAALISVNNKTGEILSMVWWVDYFDIKNQGYNNMITSRLQPGSTFKPFIYLLAMIKQWYTSDTIFTDEKFTFPDNYTPKNSDNKYMGKITLSQAINHSRNIPAVKCYYAAWEEEEIISFLEPLWMHSLIGFKKDFLKTHGYNYVYAAPMSLGTVQITPLELASAYSVLWNSGIKNNITPILQIIDTHWNILENIDTQSRPIQILEKKDTTKINLILSNQNDRPQNWNYFLSIPNRPLAAKTGTSSKQYKKEKTDKEDTIAPKDLWTVGYTPQITTVVWAGNTSGEELTGKAYGLTGAGPIMRDFMTFAHQDLEIETWE